jgi:transposase
MEDILEVYERAYNPQFPLLCFDERPYQLLQGLAQELPMKPGCAAKVDYQYSRRGTCCLLAAVEPRACRRQVEVHRHRGKREYASFMRGLAAKYPEAKRIVLIQDNLNTHGPGCFYEFYPADEARALAKRFEIHFTPKKASWLNMAEIAFSVMSKQCFARRIGSIRELRTQVRGWQKRRNKELAKIGWRFTTDKARDKLQRHYDAVLN